MRGFAIVAVGLFWFCAFYFPGCAQVKCDGEVGAELTADPPLVINIFTELSATAVDSPPAFRVDTRGIRALLIQAGITIPVTIDILAAGMRQRVNPKPLAPDSPDFPDAVGMVFPEGGGGAHERALPGKCRLLVRNASNRPLARLKARFHLFPAPEIRRFVPLLVHAERGGVDRAAFWCNKQRKKLRKECFDTLAWILLHRGDDAAAGGYWKRCLPPRRAAGFQALGDVHLHNRRYREAMAWYDRAGPSGNRALTCGVLADLERDEGHADAARKWLERAVVEYDSLIKTPTFSWKDLDIRDRLARLHQWRARPKTAADNAADERLKTILERCDAYCRKLFHSSFDFVCIEDEMQEMGGAGTPVNYMLLALKQPREAGTVTYEYDYRLVRKDRKIREVRTRIRCNGRRVDEQVVEPPVDHPGVEKIIFGPLAMFESRWQWRFRYRILGEEPLWGEKAVVLDVIPRGRPEKNRFFGKVWIHEKDGSVMKIAFNPKSLANFELVRSLVARQGGMPDMVVIAEYGQMRRGIRFPSRYFFEDAYVNAKGKRVLRFRNDHRYRDYRFFSISSEVKLVE